MLILIIKTTHSLANPHQLFMRLIMLRTMIRFLPILSKGRPLACHFTPEGAECQ